MKTKSILTIILIQLVLVVSCRSPHVEEGNSIISTVPKPLLDARRICLPSFVVQNATHNDAFFQLLQAGKENDPEKKGVNILLVRDPANPRIEKEISLRLGKVTLAEAAERLAKEMDLQMVPHTYAIVFSPFHRTQ